MPLRINGELIGDEAVRTEFQMLRPRYDEMMADSPMDPIERQAQLWEWSRENVIEKVLLRQEAAKDTAPVAPERVEQEVARALGNGAGGENCPTPANDTAIRQEVEARLRLERLIEKVTRQVPRPKNKLTGDFYQKNKEQFRLPERVRAAHIVKHVQEGQDEAETRRTIEQALEELEAGAPFAQVADKYSDCPGNGGDLGYFPRGEMVEEFERVVFGLEPGRRSGIFRSPFGFHIAVLLDRRPASYRPFNEVKGQIEELLQREMKERAVEEFVDRLKAKASIEKVSSKPGAAAAGEREA